MDRWVPSLILKVGRLKHLTLVVRLSNFDKSTHEKDIKFQIIIDYKIYKQQISTWSDTGWACRKCKRMLENRSWYLRWSDWCWQASSGAFSSFPTTSSPFFRMMWSGAFPKLSERAIFTSLFVARHNSSHFACNEVSVWQVVKAQQNWTKKKGGTTKTLNKEFFIRYSQDYW